MVSEVGALYFFHFKKNNAGNVAVSKTEGTDDSAKPGKVVVAYFDMDSIEANFSMFKEMQKEVGKKEDSMNSVLNSAKS